MTDTSPAATEVALQRLLTTYIFTGLLFLVLPGTFLGVWNLISISGRHSLAGLSPSWLQAHGHIYCMWFIVRTARDHGREATRRWRSHLSPDKSTQWRRMKAHSILVRA